MLKRKKEVNRYRENIFFKKEIKERRKSSNIIIISKEYLRLKVLIRIRGRL